MSDRRTHRAIYSELERRYLLTSGDGWTDMAGRAMIELKTIGFPKLSKRESLRTFVFKIKHANGRDKNHITSQAWLRLLQSQSKK